MSVLCANEQAHQKNESLLRPRVFLRETRRMLWLWRLEEALQTNHPITVPSCQHPFALSSHMQGTTSVSALVSWGSRSNRSGLKSFLSR